MYEEYDKQFAKNVTNNMQKNSAWVSTGYIGYIAVCRICMIWQLLPPGVSVDGLAAAPDVCVEHKYRAAYGDQTPFTSPTREQLGEI